MNKLPEGWKEVELKDVCEIVMGQSPPGKSYNNRHNGTPFFQGKAEFGKRYPEIKKWTTNPSKLAKPNDLLISIRAPVGSVNICNVNCCIGRGLAALRTTDKLETLYLFHILQFKEKEISNLGTGSTFKAINSKQLNSIRFILPPLPTQQKIVSILEKAEKAKEWRKEADELTKEFLKSVFMEMFGDPIKNTKKWQLKKFEEVIRLRRGFDLPVQDRAVGKYPLLASNGVIDSISGFKVTGPGIVTGRSGTIGKVNYVKENYWPLNTTLYSEDLHGNNPLYLLYFLQVYDLERFVRGTGVPTLNRNLFHNEMIIYPPLHLQQKFASIVKEVESMKDQQKHSKEHLDNLFNALMQKAFKGEMV